MRYLFLLSVCFFFMRISAQEIEPISFDELEPLTVGNIERLELIIQLEHPIDSFSADSSSVVFINCFDTSPCLMHQNLLSGEETIISSDSENINTGNMDYPARFFFHPTDVNLFFACGDMWGIRLGQIIYSVSDRAWCNSDYVFSEDGRYLSDGYHLYDAQTGELIRYYFSEEYPENTSVFNFDLNSDGSWFAAAMYYERDSGIPLNWGVFQINDLENDISLIPSASIFLPDVSHFVSGNLTPDALDFSSPSLDYDQDVLFSPNDKWLLYVRDRGRATNLINLENIESSGLIPAIVTEIPSGVPLFSPNSEFLLVLYNGGIWIADLINLEISFLELDFAPSYGRFAISKNGKLLAIGSSVWAVRSSN